MTASFHRIDQLYGALIDATASFQSFFRLIFGDFIKEFADFENN